MLSFLPWQLLVLAPSLLAEWGIAGGLAQSAALALWWAGLAASFAVSAFTSSYATAALCGLFETLPTPGEGALTPAAPPDAAGTEAFGEAARFQVPVSAAPPAGMREPPPPQAQPGLSPEMWEEPRP